MAECGCLLPPFLRVARTAEYGRGIYAEKELSAGVDLLVSHPLVHVTPSNQRGLYCDWCISKTEYVIMTNYDVISFLGTSKNAVSVNLCDTAVEIVR